MWYNPNYINWGPKGWTCPKCNRVWGPHESQCWYCNNMRQTTTTGTSTNIINNDNEWWKDYLQQTTADSEISIGKDGSISRHGTPLKTELIDTDILDSFIKHFED